MPDAWQRIAAAVAVDDGPVPTRDEIDDLLGSARERWPSIAIPDSSLCGALAVALEDQRFPWPPDQDSIADLLVAVGCREGDEAAYRAFEAQYLAQAASKAATIAGSEADAHDILQALRVRFFSPDSPIVEYVGRGSLARLVQVAAARMALNERDSRRRRGRREAKFSDAAGFSPTCVDPELGLAKAEYRGQVKSSFEAAVAGLDSRARNVLRAHLVDGLTVEELGRTYGVHKSTVSRWVTRARESIGRRVRIDLRKRLRASELELTDVLDFVHSQLDLSLARVLDDT